MTGVAAPGPGKSALQRASAFDHEDSKPFSGEEPLNCGPRHCGQSPARAEQQSVKEMAAKIDRAGFMVFSSNVLTRWRSTLFFETEAGAGWSRPGPGPQRLVRAGPLESSRTVVGVTPAAGPLDTATVRHYFVLTGTSASLEIRIHFGLPLLVGSVIHLQHGCQGSTHRSQYDRARRSSPRASIARSLSGCPFHSQCFETAIAARPGYRPGNR